MRCYICTAFEKARSNKHKIYCGVEQLVARWAHNPKVAGSSPVPATRNPELSGFFVIYQWHVLRLRPVFSFV